MSRDNLIKTMWDKRVVRFACIGVINTLTDLAILNTLVFVFGMKLIAANIISASISIILSYFWNHYIVFRKEQPMTLKIFLKFVLVTGVSILVVQSVIIYGVQHVFTLSDISNATGFHHGAAKIVQVNGAKFLAVIVAMCWNFVLYQLVVFKKPKSLEVIEEEGVVPY